MKEKENSKPNKNSMELSDEVLDKVSGGLREIQQLGGLTSCEGSVSTEVRFTTNDLGERLMGEINIEFEDEELPEPNLYDFIGSYD